MQIEEAGIEILANDERMLTEEEARDFYKHKSEEVMFILKVLVKAYKAETLALRRLRVESAAWRSAS